jgi:hypothetical protein
MPTINNLPNVLVGTQPNDGTGDLLRDAFIKINNNFNAVYSNGQYLAVINNNDVNKPGFGWSDEKNTGFYKKNPGTIGVSLKGRDSLILDENGSITWFGSTLATQSFVNGRFATITGGAPLGANIAGITQVLSLPTAGNFIGRVAFYNGDLWIYSNYPIGNGAGLNEDPSISRADGSDNRWVRFRGDTALPIGSVRPISAPEGTIFYQTTTNTIFVYVSGSWKTLSSIITSNSPAGVEVVTTLPTISDPSNYNGRTVLAGNRIYIFVNGSWRTIDSYIIAAAGSGGSISSGSSLPFSANVGELFRLTGTNEGLYIYDSTWKRIETYVRGVTTARISTLSNLPTDLQNYNSGDLVQVSNVFYMLNLTKTNWDIFSPGNVLSTGTITVALSPNSVQTFNIQNEAVSGSKIRSNTISGINIVLNAITDRELRTNSVIGSKIFPGSVTTAKIALGAVDTLRLSDNSVTSSKLTRGSVTNEKLAANAISGDKLQVSSLSSLTSEMGTLRSGKLESSDGRMLIDLDRKIFRMEI